MVVEFVIELAGTKDDAGYLRRIGGGIVQNFDEPAGGEILNGGDGARMTQQALGRKNDERLAGAAAVVAPVHLPAQEVEVLRRSSDVAHQHIAFGAEREVTLDPRARMFGPLSLEPVWQQHHQTARLSPLGLSTGDELVDHDLRAVGEVAELRFP